MLGLKAVSISGGNVEDADGCMNPEPREEAWRFRLENPHLKMVLQATKQDITEECSQTRVGGTRQGRRVSRPEKDGADRRVYK